MGCITTSQSVDEPVQLEAAAFKVRRLHPRGFKQSWTAREVEHFGHGHQKIDDITEAHKSNCWLGASGFVMCE